MQKHFDRVRHLKSDMVLKFTIVIRKMAINLIKEELGNKFKKFDDCVKRAQELFVNHYKTMSESLT